MGDSQFKWMLPHAKRSKSLLGVPGGMPLNVAECYAYRCFLATFFLADPLTRAQAHFAGPLLSP